MSTNIATKPDDALALSVQILDETHAYAKKFLTHNPTPEDIKVIQGAIVHGMRIARGDGQMVIRKRGRGRPLGSKNKSKETSQ